MGGAADVSFEVVGGLEPFVLAGGRGGRSGEDIGSFGAGQRFELPGVVVVHTRRDEVTSVRTLYDRDLWLRQIEIPDH